MIFAVGDTLGPYRIVERLGQGGMATVFKAYHANLDRYVAIKVLHPVFKEDPHFLERFKREAQIVAKLEHPNIVPVYDYADHQGHPYLVMKFIDGETLKTRMRRAPLSLAEALHILGEVAEGLSFAHDRGVLHRDIKPSNIMLAEDDTPYITDFGLARIAQVGESTLSQDMLLGTPQYISPEQARGDKMLTPATDVYSLGVVLYEVVVGQVPFNADTPYAIVHAHIYKPLPRPSEVNPDVPPQVEAVLLRALTKEPEDRYQSAAEMMKAFRQAVAEAGMSELSAAVYRTTQPLPSPSAPTIPPDATPAAPANATAPTPILAPSQPTPALATAAAQRRRANLWVLGGFGMLLFTCLASLFIIASAVSDPKSRPWDVGSGQGQTPVSPLTPTPIALLELSLDEARAQVEARPDDPLAYLQLALAYMQNGETDQALQTLAYARDKLEIPPDYLAASARALAQNGHHDLAYWLSLETLSDADASAVARDEAGRYLFLRTWQSPMQARLISARYLQRRPSVPAYVFNALALLMQDRTLATRQAAEQLERAQALGGENWAEYHLVQGLYARRMGQQEMAEAAWRQALAMDDVPPWVVEAIQRLLDQQTPEISPFTS